MFQLRMPSHQNDTLSLKLLILQPGVTMVVSQLCEEVVWHACSNGVNLNFLGRKGSKISIFLKLAYLHV